MIFALPDGMLCSQGPNGGPRWLPKWTLNRGMPSGTGKNRIENKKKKKKKKMMIFALPDAMLCFRIRFVDPDCLQSAAPNVATQTKNRKRKKNHKKY